MVEIGHELIRSEVIFKPAKLERCGIYRYNLWMPKVQKKRRNRSSLKITGIPALLRGSYVSPSLAAHVICQKFMNAMPLYPAGKRLGTAGEQRSRKLPWQDGSSTVPKHTFSQYMNILRNS